MSIQQNKRPVAEPIHSHQQQGYLQRARLQQLRSQLPFHLEMVGLFKHQMKMKQLKLLTNNTSLEITML